MLFAVIASLRYSCSRYTAHADGVSYLQEAMKESSSLGETIQLLQRQVAEADSRSQPWEKQDEAMR